MVPAAFITSGNVGMLSGIEIQPGNGGSPSSTCQLRNGNARWPVSSARRTGTVGIASGRARVKRTPSPASASMFGVFARSSPP